MIQLNKLNHSHTVRIKRIVVLKKSPPEEGACVKSSETVGFVEDSGLNDKCKSFIHSDILISVNMTKIIRQNQQFANLIEEVVK
jgi:hypothetical protein